MPSPTNEFKAALRRREQLIGLWLGLGNAYTAELCAGAGFDWLLIDGEHAPFDVPNIVAQLQAVAPAAAAAVVRAPIGETWILKQLLDIGAQTLLVPMVETAEQARELVRAVRYPPEGVRGVGAALARASRFGRTTDYLGTANEQICLLVQVESVAALAQIEAIAAVDGVDGIFIGPSDLAADMGHLGRPGLPEVQGAIEGALTRIVATGKAAGILSSDEALARRYLELGANFVAVGTDATLLSASTAGLAARFKAPAAKPVPAGNSGY